MDKGSQNTSILDDELDRGSLGGEGEYGVGQRRGLAKRSAKIPKKN